MKKRKDGRYCKQIVIGFDEEGRRKTKNIYGTSIRDVEQRAALFKDEFKKGIAVIEDNITIKEWAEEWLKTYKSGVSKNTYSFYENIVNKHIIPTIGKKRLSSLKKVHIQGILNKLIDEGKFSTAKNVRLTINQILEQALENEYLHKNVAKNIKLPKKPKNTKRALNEFEKSLIFKAELEDNERLFLLIMLYAGLRRGEALALTINDIDRDKNIICVHQNLIFDKNKPEIKPSPKSDAGNRNVPIVLALQNFLYPYIDKMNGNYIFTMKNGELITKSSFRKMWDRIIKKLNAAAGGTSKKTIIADDITPHIFRHTYATMLYYAGVDLKTAQQLLGHSSSQITLDIYTHLDNSKTDETYAKLNNFIGASTDKHD